MLRRVMCDREPSADVRHLNARIAAMSVRWPTSAGERPSMPGMHHGSDRIAREPGSVPRLLSRECDVMASVAVSFWNGECGVDELDVHAEAARTRMDRHASIGLMHTCECGLVLWFCLRRAAETVTVLMGRPHTIGTDSG